MTTRFRPGVGRAAIFTAMISLGCAWPDTHSAPSLTPHRLLFLGNSITYSPPNESLGWSGTWGMAATDSGADYVHRLVQRFPNASYTAVNIASFESGFREFDLRSLDEYLTAQPEVVVIELGDNVTDVEGFAEYYARLLQYVQRDQTSAVLCVSTWWDEYFVNLVMRVACERAGGRFVNISAAHADPQNRGTTGDSFSNVKVGEHPGNAGMILIADALYDAIRP